MKLALPVLLVVLKLSHIEGAVVMRDFAVAILHIFFPLSFILISFLVVDLDASSLLFTIDPLAPVVVTIFVHHFPVSVGDVA